jgi:hypothetical protein
MQQIGYEQQTQLDKVKAIDLFRDLSKIHDTSSVSFMIGSRSSGSSTSNSPCDRRQGLPLPAKRSGPRSRRVVKIFGPQIPVLSACGRRFAPSRESRANVARRPPPRQSDGSDSGRQFVSGRSLRGLIGDKCQRNPALILGGLFHFLTFAISAASATGEKPYELQDESHIHLSKYAKSV